MSKAKRALVALSLSMSAAGCALDEGPSDPVTEPAIIGHVEEQGARREHHCVLPWGIDWNQVLHLRDAAIVIPACPEIHLGDRYVPLAIQVTNTREGSELHPVVYPDGYVPSRKAPMHDFLHKLVRHRYVVHPGGQEYTFEGRDIVQLTTVGDLWHDSGFFDPQEFPEPAAALLGKLPPLPLGTYSVDIYETLSAEHCDGLTTERALSCYPAGEQFVFPQNFSVVP